MDDARIAEDDEMTPVRADKDDAASHGRRADRVSAPGAVRRTKIRDPADSVVFGHGAGIERMQLAIVCSNIMDQVLAPSPDNEHVVPRRTGPPVIIVAVAIRSLFQISAPDFASSAKSRALP
jgi:hypothetical protein